MGLTLCRWPSKATCAPAFGWAPKKGPAPSSSLAVAWQSSSEVAGTGKAPSRWAGRASPVRHPVEDAEVALSQLPAELFLRAALHWGDTRVQGNTIKTKISLFPWYHLCTRAVLSAFQIIPPFASKFTFWQPGHSYFVFSQNGTTGLNDF